MVTKQELLAKVDSATVASKDEAAIAAAFNLGRVKFQKTAIGIGTILEVLGTTVGNTFLDYIWNTPDFRWVKLVIEQGNLNLGSPMVQSTLDQFIAAGLIPAQEGANLKALGYTEDNITQLDVAAALERD